MSRKPSVLAQPPFNKLSSLKWTQHVKGYLSALFAGETGHQKGWPSLICI